MFKVKGTMDYDNKTKTRAEKGKGKGAKTKQEFNQRTVREKERNMELAAQRNKAAAPGKHKWAD